MVSVHVYVHMYDSFLAIIRNTTSFHLELKNGGGLSLFVSFEQFCHSWGTRSRNTCNLTSRLVFKSFKPDVVGLQNMDNHTICEAKWPPNCQMFTHLYSIVKLMGMIVSLTTVKNSSAWPQWCVLYSARNTGVLVLGSFNPLLSHFFSFSSWHSWLLHVLFPASVSNSQSAC